MDLDFTAAIRLHQSGDHAAAARLYDALLKEQPDHADALHMYGLLHHQLGCHSKAVELIGRAAHLQPGNAGFHANLAEAYRALGQHQLAADCCRAAMRLQPHFPVAFNNLGLALQGLGRHDEAAQQFRAALSQRRAFALAENNLGISLRKLDRIGEALEAFRSAVALAPNLATAHASLGQLLVDLGQLDEGMVHCREAVRLQPAVPGVYDTLAAALRRLGRVAEADEAYALARRLSAEQARVQAERGLILCRDGRRADAFNCLRRAVELAPQDAEMWQKLADVHVADEDYQAAIFCLERSVALDPQQATAHSNLGMLLEDAGRRTEAAACFRRALQLDPRHIDAMVNQGSLHEVLGQMAEAEACYRRAQAVDGDAPLPLARMATLLAAKLPDHDLQSIRRLLAESKLTRAHRSAILFGLAHVLDARGEYAEVAACLAEANAGAGELKRWQGHHYDPVDQGHYIDRVLEHYTPELFQRLGGTGDPTRLPVFVFGLPRSGRTLAEQVLSSHSQVHGAGELRLGRQVSQLVPELVGRDNDMKACLDALDPPVLKELARRYLAGVQEISQRDRSDFTPQRVVDKMPDNYLYLGLLALLFPRATFIHIRRDPRDVAVSCWMTNFRSIRWANDMDHIAGRFRDHERIMAHWNAVLPVPIHEVVYEQLVNDFEAEARRLISACSLDWEPACLNFHQSRRPVRTASVAQVRQPLYRKSVARWRHYEEHLAELFARLPVSPVPHQPDA